MSAGGGVYQNRYSNYYGGSVSMPIMGGRTPRFNNGYSGDSSPRGEPQLSTTNLYIHGLSATTGDEDLRSMCATYGKITSTKAIMDKLSGQCKGYGFVDFETSEAASAAVEGLQQRGIQAQMAKARQNLTVRDTEQDPTNLYLANLPINFTESQLEQALQKYGMVISTRILRNANGESRGVGFARMDGKEKCEIAIQELNGKLLPESPPDAPPLLVKLADSGHRKKRPFNPYMAPGMVDYQEMYGRNPYNYVMPYGQTGYPQPYQQYDMSALASQMGGMHLQNGAGGGEGNGPAAGTGMPYSQVSYYQNQQPYYQDNSSSYAAAVGNQQHYGGGNSDSHEPMGTFVAPGQNGNGGPRGGPAVKYGK